MKPLTVIDIFCGAGGFSEGFRQHGFEIKEGIDRWQPAIDTFNHNFGLSSATRNVLEFSKSVEAIELLPDTDVILGSPPCVSFSSSNISGKADKSDGVTLTQTFLRIVAVKKWKPGSILKAWFMENVPQSAKHLAKEYSFKDLGLDDWANAHKIGPSKIAISLEPNREIINSADYGSPQARVRVISGEIVSKKRFIVPESSHSKASALGKQNWRTIRESIRKLPEPSLLKGEIPTQIEDPNYPGLKIASDQLTDHFYDTGLYQCEWRLSRYFKTNHPYMGRMSFPENDSKPSRTVTATKIGSSREALIYRSGYARTGNGEFRTPTVREAASLMGFPITYQFKGSEGTKWRLVGNAVCPSISRALAKVVRAECGLDEIASPLVEKTPNLINVKNLNDFRRKLFDSPPTRNKNSRFRRHPFKDGNMTVTLSNYDIDNKDSANPSRWLASVQYGSGEGFPTYTFGEGIHDRIEPFILKHENGREFIDAFEQRILDYTASGLELQRLYEMQRSEVGFLEPTELLESLAKLIEDLKLVQPVFLQNGNAIFTNKKTIPTKQLFALYAISRIAHKANEAIERQLSAIA